MVKEHKLELAIERLEERVAPGLFVGIGIGVGVDLSVHDGNGDNGYGDHDHGDHGH